MALDSGAFFSSPKCVRELVVLEIQTNNASQRSFVQHNDVVQALLSQRADEAPRIRICHGDLGAVSISLMPTSSTR